MKNRQTTVNFEFEVNFNGTWGCVKSYSTPEQARQHQVNLLNSPNKLVSPPAKDETRIVRVTVTRTIL